MNLPEWEVRISRNSPGWLWLICPRCGGRALVRYNWGKGGWPSRPCSYCFKVNKIPGRTHVEPSL